MEVVAWPWLLGRPPELSLKGNPTEFLASIVDSKGQMPMPMCSCLEFDGSSNRKSCNPKRNSEDNLAILKEIDGKLMHI